MIGKITGFVDSINEDRCLIDVNGVGYVIYLSGKSLDFLRQFPKDKKISLIIETIFKQESMELFGFVNDAERSWFLQLSKVQGVGSKMAQKILGSYNIEEICHALLKSNSQFFTKISGIGPKLANRIVTELKDAPNKLGFTYFQISGEAINDGESISNDQNVNDAVIALENLGYKKHECLKVLQIIIKNDPEITIETLITSALRELSRKKLA